MNWIDFKKEKPKVEPRRQILVRWNTPTLWYEVYEAYETQRFDGDMSRYEITHWSEIEPPPKPDPFEEWWGSNETRFTDELSGSTIAKAAWDAAIKHAKGES